MARFRGLDLVETFLVVAEELNFRRSAERLHLDNSALSRRIFKLERLVGFPLLDRTTRTVALTPAGKTFYEDNRDLLGGYARSIEVARAVAQGREGTLTVAYMAFAAVDLLPRSVADYRRCRPNVSLNLRYVRTQGQKQLLAQGSVDVGFMIGPVGHPKFDSIRLASDRLHLVAPRGHAALAGPTVPAQDATRYPLILGDMVEWEFYRLRLDDMFGQSGSALVPAFQTSNTIAMMGLVRAGLGVTILPDSLLPTLHEGLEARPFEPAHALEIVVAWRHEDRSPLVRDFVRSAMLRRHPSAILVSE